jgi:ABC-type branched-subunit amino acid transport system ATPase component
MNRTNPFGLYLLQKERKDQHVLKELLQLLKTNSNGRVSTFAYIEAEMSLLPDLTLWENLQLVVGPSHWKEYTRSLKTELQPLTKLIAQPDKLANKALPWEKFTVSLLKGLMSPGHLLIDVNEDLLSPLMIQNFKKTILSVADERQIYLASANSGLWLDCAHSLVNKNEHLFEVQPLDSVLIKRHWIA